MCNLLKMPWASRPASHKLPRITPTMNPSTSPWRCILTSDIRIWKQIWLVLNCDPKSTEHVLTVLSVPTSPASSLRSTSSILRCCFYRLGSRQEQRTTSSLHPQSCSLGCMYPLPSISHPLPSLSPRRFGRGLTNDLCVCSLCPLQPSVSAGWCSCRAKNSGKQVEVDIRYSSGMQVRGCVPA